MGVKVRGKGRGSRSKVLEAQSRALWNFHELWPQHQSLPGGRPTASWSDDSFQMGLCLESACDL